MSAFKKYPEPRTMLRVQTSILFQEHNLICISMPIKFTATSMWQKRLQPSFEIRTSYTYWSRWSVHLMDSWVTVIYSSLSCWAEGQGISPFVGKRSLGKSIKIVWNYVFIKSTMKFIGIENHTSQQINYNYQISKPNKEPIFGCHSKEEENKKKMENNSYYRAKTWQWRTDANITKNKRAQKTIKCRSIHLRNRQWDP